MNKSVGFILLLLMFTNTMNAELANGKIEEFFIKNGIEERKIRIYYPNNNSVDAVSYTHLTLPTKRIV